MANEKINGKVESITLVPGRDGRLCLCIEGGPRELALADGCTTKVDGWIFDRAALLAWLATNTCRVEAERGSNGRAICVEFYSLEQT